MTAPANDIDATGGCCCAGCAGEGPCDLGEECAYGCGARVVAEGEVCDRCEDEVTGRCHNCGGTGTDSDVVAVDPYPIHMPFPCGWCEGTGETK